MALSLNVRFVKSGDSPAIKVRASNDPGAIPITLTEEAFLQKYPLCYNDLVIKLKELIPDFKQGNNFYRIKRDLEAEPKYCMVRLLDPTNPKSAKKKYYSQAIIGKLQSRLRPKK